MGIKDIDRIKETLEHANLEATGKFYLHFASNGTVTVKKIQTKSEQCTGQELRSIEKDLKHSSLAVTQIYIEETLGHKGHSDDGTCNLTHVD